MNEIVFLLCQKQPTALKYLLIKHQNSQKQNGSKCTNDNPTWTTSWCCMFTRTEQNDALTLVDVANDYVGEKENRNNCLANFPWTIFYACYGPETHPLQKSWESTRTSQSGEPIEEVNSFTYLGSTLDKEYSTAWKITGSRFIDQRRRLGDIKSLLCRWSEWEKLEQPSLASMTSWSLGK